MRKLILVIFILLISLSPVDASVYKGLKYFKQKCLHCHGKALEFVTHRSYDQWAEYLDADGGVLYDMHEKSADAVTAMEYFNGHKYRKSVKHFRDFFLEYASDTGNIPACD